MQVSDPMPWSVASEPLRSYFHLEFGSEAVSLMVHLLYLCAYQFTRLIVRKTSSFFTLFNIVCISGALRSFFWISVVLFNHFNTEKVPSMGRSLVLQFSLYMDIWEDQFWQCMLFLITCNSLISQRNSYSITRKYCTTVSVLLFVLLSSFFSLFLIYESHMTRMYVQNIGTIDIADPASEAIPNINRLFYVFTIGSFICCIIHFFLVSRQQKNKTTPIGTSFVREHGIFVPLTITILLNSLCCLGLEYINHVDFKGNQAKRIELVRVLSCANTLAKLSLPLMILVSNCFYQQKEEDPKSVEFEMA